MFELDSVPKSTHPIGGFWQEFGRFMSYYAAVEEQMNFLVRHYYKIDLRSSNLLLGALRCDLAINHLNRLREANIIPDQDWIEIEVLKGQLGEISRLRNDLAHFGVAHSIPSGYKVISRWAPSRSKERQHVVSVEILIPLRLTYSKSSIVL